MRLPGVRIPLSPLNAPRALASSPMTVGQRVRSFRDEIAAKGVRLVLVSKGQPLEKIADAYQHGQRDFGESKVQDLLSRYAHFSKDIRWHMVGHLQRNKVKHIAPFIHLVHSVDSIQLLEVLNKEARKNHRLLKCLIQVKIAQEEEKHGLSVEETECLFSENPHKKYDYLSIIGLMGMASHTPHRQTIAREYAVLGALFSACKKHYDTAPLTRHELSMGMSGDYEIALQKGTTMLRIGRFLFYQ